ncbi:methyltransferase [bacterium]|nr:methyltransferase [bacterium]
MIASDISEESIKNAQENAKIAGVENDIQFKVQDFLSYNIPNNDKAWIITNPPYGKRITSNNL